MLRPGLWLSASLILPATVSPAANVAGWTTYQSAALGIEIMAPLGWQPGPDAAPYRLFAPDVRNSGATLTISKRPGRLPEAVQRSRQWITTRLQDGRLLSEEPPARGGRAAHALTFTATDRGVPIKGTLTFIELAGQVFLVDGEANTEASARYHDTFLRAAASLHEYAASGTHMPLSGVDVPRSWEKRRATRLKLSARAPSEWTSRAARGLFLSEMTPLLTLQAPGHEKSRALVQITSRADTKENVGAWAKERIEALPKAKIQGATAVKLSGGRSAFVIVFMTEEKGRPFAHTLTMIAGKERVILVLCRAGFKDFKNANPIFNKIVDSVQEDG